LLLQTGRLLPILGHCRSPLSPYVDFRGVGRNGQPAVADAPARQRWGRRNVTVGAILKGKDPAVVSVLPSASVLEIAAIISARRIGAVLVLNDDGGVAGIVSERDVVKALANHAGKVIDMRADDLMTRNVITATPKTTVDEAMEIMDAGYFRHLPVLENGKLAGIISIRDLVKYRIMLHEHDVDSLKQYIARQV
jgi:CBS domain-containing protein